MTIRLLLPLLFLLLLPCQLLALDFSLHKQLGEQPGPTLLVIGGIQGDEPGGFNSAALLATRYRVERGSLWVVPNLNFPSIIQRSRGIHGDMNRKFAALPKSDPEYHQIVRIKQIITDPQVDLVFNLHDGSGFYRPTRIDRLHNPDRWGQSCIIDQSVLPGQPFGQLEQLSRTTIERVNAAALSPADHFHLHNTRTAVSDTEMKQSLTYFAVRNRKPAFGIEASKSFPTHIRAYYLLTALEAYMDQVGLKYQRDFPLSPAGIKQALDENLQLSFGDGRIQLPVKDLRPTLNYFPLPKSGPLDFQSNNPLVAVVPYRDRFRIHYGNNRLSFLKPQFFDYDRSIDRVEMEIDGITRQVPFGATVPVDDRFSVHSPAGYRVNVIGFFKHGLKNEDRLEISQRQIRKRYSVDKAGEIFRVEVYHDDKFSGMVLVDFGGQKNGPLVTQAGLQKRSAVQPN